MSEQTLATAVVALALAAVLVVLAIALAPYVQAAITLPVPR